MNDTNNTPETMSDADLEAHLKDRMRTEAEQLGTSIPKDADDDAGWTFQLVCVDSYKAHQHLLHALQNWGRLAYRATEALIELQEKSFYGFEKPLLEDAEQLIGLYVENSDDQQDDEQNERLGILLADLRARSK